jgi:hypothetical protein
MSNAASKARSIALPVFFVLLTVATPVSALDYEDLDVIYAENFDDDTSMSGLVPQVDAYGAGRLYEGDIGNGPFVPLSLESAPAVPRGAAQASVGTTFFPGFPLEAKVLSYDANVASPIPGTGSLGVRGTFANLSTVTNGAHVIHVTVVATASASSLETNRSSATLTIAGSGGPGGTNGFLSANDGLAPPAPAELVLLPPAVTAALLGGSPFQLTLVVDRDAEIATAELVVGASVVTAGPHALAVVTPGVDLAYQGQALVVQNIDPYTAGNLTPGPDDATIDFDSFEVRGTAPIPPVADLGAVADSFLRAGHPHRNEGANPALRIQATGDNRVVLAFDAASIADFVSDGLGSATLVLTIGENADNWGPNNDRTVSAHPLTESFAEGNGLDVGVPASASTRGSGAGVTWKCAVDAQIANQKQDCDPAWDGGSFGAATADPVIHQNGQLGVVSWDVTDDVLAGATGWVIKKTNESQTGQVMYISREGATTQGDASLAPRLILER